MENNNYMPTNETVFGITAVTAFILSIFAGLPNEAVQISNSLPTLNIDRGQAVLIYNNMSVNMPVEEFLKNGFISTWRVVYTPSDKKDVQLVIPNDLITTFLSGKQCENPKSYEKKVWIGSIKYTICTIKNVTSPLVIEYSSGF